MNEYFFTAVFYAQNILFFKLLTLIVVRTRVLFFYYDSLLCVGVEYMSMNK